MANITPTYEPSTTLQRGIDPFRLMREMMRWDPFQAITPTMQERPDYYPSFDVAETNDAYLFVADVPGVKEQDLDISVTGNRITVSGKREEDRRDDVRNVFAMERGFGRFSRAFTLPDGCDFDDVHANLDNGVLTVSVKKKATVQAKRVPLGKNTKNKVH